MNTATKCPICQSAGFENYGGSCHMVSTNGRDSAGFDCDVCGKFEISTSAFAGPLDPEKSTLTTLQRAALSHRLRASAGGGELPMITTNWFEHFIADPILPSPAIQASNIIRYVGDAVTRSGEKITHIPLDFHAVIGAVNREAAAQLAKELCERNILKAIDATSMSGTNLMNVTLTLDGWEQYESERQGKVAGKYGFIAMKFNDPVLDPFVADVVKPAIKEGIGFDLVDLRNVARAGIIDNIMRTQIRDSAFVIVDLTHDNSGAYWEAGYAEGLGKPVIYICEKSKFDEKKTHFDTNHCTTVPWSHDGRKNFGEELVATLRRSLNLFPGAT